jgi:AraC-like DNA-binding protein
MNRICLVPAGSVCPFLEFLQDIGAPIERILARVGVPDCVFEHKENLLPLNSATRFVDAAARIEGRHLGIEVGRQTLVGQFGAFGELVLQANTVGQAVALAERHCRLYNPALRITCSTNGDFATWQHEYPRELGLGHLQLHAYTLMLTINQARQWLGSDWTPLELRIDADLAQEASRYHDLSDCRLTAASGPMGMRFHREVLAHPLPAAGSAADRCALMTKLHRDAPPTNLAAAVRHLVRAHLPTGAPSVDQVALLLGTSARSLQRSLASRGTSLTAIVDSVRRDRAIELFLTGSVSVLEVALSCGYTDPANFTRAFRRWTGMSPRDFCTSRGRPLRRAPEDRGGQDDRRASADCHGLDDGLV